MYYKNTSTRKRDNDKNNFSLFPIPAGFPLYY